MSSKEEIEIIDLTIESSCSDMEEDDDIVDITESERFNEKEFLSRTNKCHTKRGYTMYEIGEYYRALTCYNTAIAIYADNSNDWLFRSKIHYKINSYPAALEDALFSLRLDSGNLQSLYWILQLRLETGNLKKCGCIIKVIKDSSPSEIKSKTLQQWELKVNRLSDILQKLDSKNITNPEETLETMEAALEIAPAFISILLKQANLLLNIQYYDEARMTCVQVLKFEPENLIALQYHAIAYYQKGQLGDAIRTTNEVLKISPNNEEYQNFLIGLTYLIQEMDKAQTFKNNGNCVEYKKIYNTCIGMFSSAAIFRNQCLETNLHYNLATLLFNEGNIYECLEFCDKANEADKNNINARILKAQVYMQENLRDEAEAELKAVQKYENLPHIERKLREVYQTVTYYAVLGLEPSASCDAVKKAYFKALREYHPDKNQGASKTESEVKKKQLENTRKAFNVLSNANAKRIYDQQISKDGNTLASLKWN